MVKPFTPEQYESYIIRSPERLDLRPVLSSIMEMENWILERIPLDQKLVIILGEIHTFQTDILLQQAVLQAHKKQLKQMPERSFAYGCEIDNTFIARKSGIPDCDELLSGHGMDTFTRFYRNYAAFGARNALLKFCVGENISVDFNDAAMQKSVGPYDRLDIADPQVHAILKDYYQKSNGDSSKILPLFSDNSARTPTGMALRNRAIVENAQAHAERTNSRIYIQQCGLSHVFGDEKDGFAFSESLYEQFKTAGFYVLPVYPSFNFFGKNPPKEAAEAMKECIKVNLHSAPDDLIKYKKIARLVCLASALEF